jgi:superfamily II DNA or RNA helicase
MKLRSYQVKLHKPAVRFIKSPLSKRIAQIYAPTGAGKTVCFIELIKEAILLGMKNIAVLHPRIALSKDQLRRFKKELGTSVTFSSFHSGGHYVGEETVREIGTLDADALERVIEQSSTVLSKPHITFSSYHSFGRVLHLPFELVICDEAQYLVQDNFLEYVPKIPGKVLCYTATPITNEMEDGLMNDKSLFGPVIGAVEPKVLIKPGYIVAPLIHRMECGTNRKGKEVDIVDVIARAFVSQHKEITGYGMPYHQMLAACRNVEIDVRELESRLTELWTKISQLSNGLLTQVDVYTIEAGGAYKNGRPMPSREAAIEELKQSGTNAIVAHYDTLSEGIDVDTLTGAVIMRKMSKAKLIQTIGRCARPYIGDLDPVTFEPRKDLYNVKKGIDLRKKPRCIITLPVIDGKWIANDDGTIIAEAFIKSGYGDLITYMSKEDEKPKGKNKTTFELDEDGTVMSAVLSHKVERELEELRKLFDIKD